MIQVLIIDDHEMTRRGIKFFIEQEEGIKVIGEANNGEEGISLCRSLNPDVVLMDVRMPMLDGIDSTKKIFAEMSHIKIIMLTGLENQRQIRDSLRAGAQGYCLKDINEGRLITAIKSVSAGDMWLDSSIARSLLESSLNNVELPVEHNDHKNNFGLSDREMQIVSLIVEGKTNQKIASELFLSVDTIKSYLKTIMNKLSVSDRTQTAVKAVREGMF